jgi:hypothetical protein
MEHADLRRENMQLPAKARFRSAIVAISLALTAANPALPQSVITTVAGTGFLFPGGHVAAQSPIGDPPKVSVDPAGNVYICTASFNVIIKVGPDGIATVIAGNGIDGFSGDGGPATSAMLNNPYTPNWRK